MKLNVLLITGALAIWLACMVPIAKASPIDGWVLGAQYPTGITYTIPDPDYSHFLSATVQPLFDYDLFMAQHGWFSLIIPYTAFNCYCTIYPEPRIPTEILQAAGVPEPAHLGAVGGIGGLVAILLLVRRRKL